MLFRIGIHLLTGLLIFILMLAESAQTPSPSKEEHYHKVASAIVKRALTDQKGYRMLGELCALGPRLSGSPQLITATRWAKEKLESLGLDRITLQPVMVPHWVRGDVEAATIVGPSQIAWRSLNICALGGSIGTPPEGITAEVLEVHNAEELKALGEKVRGKIIFFNRPFDPTQIYTFRGYGGAVGQRVHGASQAAKVGAVAVLVRSITPAHDNVPHTGNMHYEKDVPRIPAAAVGIQDAEFLSRALKQYPNLKIDVQLSCQTLEDVPAYNIIGDIVGTEYPDEYIVVSGHFDCWDKGVGAHDDGGGCMQALEVLDLFKRLKIKPKRTIRCIFFVNEENGLRGARAYARLADSLGIHHIAAIESDRGCFTPRGFNVTGDSLVIRKIADWLPYLQTATIDWVRKGGSGADVGQLKNVPALIGYVPDGQRYFDFHHSDNDVFEAVHPREFELGSASIAILTYLLSEEGL